MPVPLLLVTQLASIEFWNGSAREFHTVRDVRSDIAKSRLFAAIEAALYFVIIASHRSPGIANSSKFATPSLNHGTESMFGAIWCSMMCASSWRIVVTGLVLDSGCQLPATADVPGLKTP